MHSRLLVILSLISLYFIQSSFINEQNSDGFQQVINQTSDSLVKTKLQQFQLGGIEKTTNTENYDVEKVIAFAKTFIGTPHSMGGTTKKGIDCSGLVQVVHMECGIVLPHSSHEQGRYGTIISCKDSLLRGDLLFYYSSYNSSNFITHVGIYLGDGTFIHASATSGVIITKTSDTYWKSKYLFSTRLKS